LPAQALPLPRQPLGYAQLGAKNVGLGEYHGEASAYHVGFRYQARQDEMVRQ